MWYIEAINDGVAEKAKFNGIVLVFYCCDYDNLKRSVFIRLIKSCRKFPLCASPFAVR